MIRSAAVLFTGNILVAVSNLIRNIIIANILGIVDFGIASTFTVFISMLSIFFATGLPALIVQSRASDLDRMQNSFQLFQLIQSVIAVAVLFVLAEPFAAFMGAPDTVWAYRLFALSALFPGLVHMDVHRLQRDMNFTPFVLHILLPVLLSMLALWPLYQVFPDWRAVLWMLIIQTALATLISHLAARKRYRLGFDRKHLKTAVSFGVPLLAEGFLFFVILNGERMIVSNRYGLEVLAHFSIAFMLIALPVAIMTKSLQSFFLPVLSERQEDEEAFGRFSVFTCQALILAGAAIAAGFAVAGAFFVTELYGHRYDAAIPLGILLAVMQGIRLARVGPLTISLSKGNSKPTLLTSLIRFAFIPLAYFVAVAGYNLTLFILTGIIGEVLAFIAALYFAGRIDARLWMRVLPALIWFTVILLISAFKLTQVDLQSLPWWHLTTYDVLIVIVFLAVPLFMPEIRHWVFTKIVELTGRKGRQKQAK